MADLPGTGTGSFSFVIPESEYPRADSVLNVYRADSCRLEVFTEKNLAMLSVVGPGAAYDSNIAAMYYDTLLDENVEIHHLSLSVIRISALVDERAVDRVVSCLRARFEEAGLYGPAERTVNRRFAGGGDQPFYIRRKNRGKAEAAMRKAGVKI